MTDIFGGSDTASDDCKNCPILERKIEHLEAKLFAIRLVAEKHKKEAEQVRSEPGSRGSYGFAKGKIELASQIIRIC